jgi:hypothetical protein
MRAGWRPSGRTGKGWTDPPPPGQTRHGPGGNRLGREKLFTRGTWQARNRRLHARNARRQRRAPGARQRARPPGDGREAQAGRGRCMAGRRVRGMPATGPDKAGPMDGKRQRPGITPELRECECRAGGLILPPPEPSASRERMPARETGPPSIYRVQIRVYTSHATGQRRAQAGRQRAGDREGDGQTPRPGGHATGQPGSAGRGQPPGSPGKPACPPPAPRQAARRKGCLPRGRAGPGRWTMTGPPAIGKMSARMPGR